MSGGSGDDTQYGGDGNDLIYANVGADTTYGEAGNDNLWALARADVTPGPNGETDTVGDTLDGGPGDDTFHTRDGEVDRITCGDGNDTALLDNVDVITDATADEPQGLVRERRAQGRQGEERQGPRHRPQRGPGPGRRPAGRAAAPAPVLT